jgi:hypothetical protein
VFEVEIKKGGDQTGYEEDARNVATLKEVSEPAHRLDALALKFSARYRAIWPRMTAPGLTGGAGGELASASASVSLPRRGVAARCEVSEFNSVEMLAGSTGVKASAWPGLPV